MFDLIALVQFLEFQLFAQNDREKIEKTIFRCHILEPSSFGEKQCCPKKDCFVTKRGHKLYNY